MSVADVAVSQVVDSRRPLAGLRVLCLAEQYPGPYATLILADLGADVIMVERSPGGDPSRGLPAFFESLNRDKRSVVIDLKQPAGVDALHRLAATADVFIEGFRPGTVDRLGVGWEALREVNPRLVYLSISGFGQDGPYRLRPAHDLSIQAAAGLLAPASSQEIGFSGGLAIGDLTSGMFAVIGALSALRARDERGVGSYVDVSMMDCLVSLMTSQLGPALNRQPSPWLDEEPGYGVYPASDGLLTLSISQEQPFWRALCTELGMPEAGQMDVPTRRGRCEELRAQIADRISCETRAHWSDVFERAGVPFALVSELADVVDDPHIAARGLFVDLPAGADHPRRRHVRQPLAFDGEHYGPAGHMPRLGEHTLEVLAAAGFTPGELRDLVDAGAVGTAPPAQPSGER
jgi:crotonobetainyl-CoA:carnitine CoA-transferase CaiB-like acyl-CoA transferase